MTEQVVHHIEIWITRDGNKFVTDFCSKFGFRRSAQRKTSSFQQWLVTAGHQQLQFLITYANPELKEGQRTDTEEIIITEQSGSLVKNDPYVTWPTSCANLETGSCNWERKNQSSVYNVSLSVNDLQQRVDHLQNCGVTFVRSLETISDDHGSVTLATIRSCVGNVVHTLIDRQNYRGHFLPGFTAVKTQEEEIRERREEGGKEKSFFTNFDHVTFAVNLGTSTNVLQWYEQCFGMKRFNVNPDEDPNEGFLINLPGIALRLKALEYWKCAEVGLCSNNANGTTNILFVIAESLAGSAPNQVDTFLEAHGGPGIQHIGLLTTTIMDTVEWLKGQGVKFVEPPHTYYTEVEPLMQICKLMDSLKALQKLGILIDVENREQEEEEPRYLMQKFTQPLFEKDTFFLEVIQRNGALGFGAANIIALWKSLQLMLDEKSQQRTERTSI